MSESSESREVEMVDAEEEEVEVPNDSVEQDGQTSNSHQATIDPIPNTDMATTQATNSELIQSVEKDDTRSPTTADEEPSEASPPIEKSSATSPEDQERAVAVSGPSKSTVPNIGVSKAIKFGKEVARLKQVLEDTSPEAAQKVLREEWRKFIFSTYDEDHISFILRAGIKNSNTNIINRILKDDSIIKEPLLNAVVQHPHFVVSRGLMANVLQNIKLSQLLSLVPMHILDAVAAERVKDAETDDLISWLATGERLGFKPDDLVYEDELVVPNIASQANRMLATGPPPIPNSNGNFASSHTDPMLEEERAIVDQKRLVEEKRLALENEQRRKLAEQQRDIMRERETEAPTATSMHPVIQDTSKPVVQAAPDGPLDCPACGLTLPTFSGYTYHINKKPCHKQPPDGLARWKYWCENCCSGFTQSVGLSYHKKRKVCENTEFAPPTSPSHQLHEEQDTRRPQDQSYPRPMAPPRPDAIVPLQRPPMHSQLPAQSFPAVVLPLSPAKSGSSVPKPPLSTPSYSTPNSQKVQEVEIRHSPSELPPERLAALEAELQKVTNTYEAGLAAIPDSWTEQEKESRRFSLKNQWSTKKSQIRKKYGVSLRLRENQKGARRAAGLDGPSERRDVPMQSSSPSFPPINTPPPAVGSPGLRHEPPPNPLLSINPRQASDSNGFAGFGVLQPTAPQGQPPQSYRSAYPPVSSGKRRRTEEYESPRAGTYHSFHSASQPQPQRPTSGLAMVETSSQDAAARFAKKPSKIVPVTARSPVSEPKSAGLPERSGTKISVIDLVESSSDSGGDGDIPAVARKAPNREEKVEAMGAGEN